MFDLRLALRRLRAAPAFAIAAILTLALGIGVNAFAFSAVRAMLVAPLPFPDGNRLVWITAGGGDGQAPGDELSAEETAALARVAAFDVVANIGARSLIREAGARRAEWRGLWVTTGVFNALGITPASGRVFGATDMPRTQAPAMMLGYERWQRDFGGDPAVIGSVLQFADKKAFTVVGVLPRGVEFPFGRAPGSSTGAAYTVGVQDFWVLGQDRPDDYPGGTTMARLHPERSLASAAGEAGAAAPPGRTFAVVSFRDHALGLLAPALPLLQGFAGLVLLIACANLGNLLVARAASTRREFAVRTALGAGTREMVRVLLPESLLLCAGGAALGLALARLGQVLLARVAAGHLTFADRVSIDGSVLLFTAALCLAATVVFTFVPAVLARRTPALALLGRDRGQTVSREGSRVLTVLVVTQVAIALMLLTGAALLAQSLTRLLSVETGYDRERVIAADILLYEQMREVQPFYLGLHERLRALPGVEAVGAIQSTPLTGKWTFRERVNGIDIPGSFVALDYFEAMNIPVVEGRAFTAREFTVSRAPSVVINDIAARLLFPGKSAVGERISLFGKPREIIGVVKGTRDVRLETPAAPQWYQPFLFGDSQLLVRTAGDPAAAIEMVRRELTASDPRLIIRRVQPLDAIVQSLVFERRVAVGLLSIFAALALSLALVGIYGVTAFTTAQRRREFGVRAALGARRGQLIGLVLRHALLTGIVGVSIGAAASVPVAATLRSLMFEITAGDPRTMIVASLALVIASVAACALPAWRAGSIDPSITLRVE